jgi:uncharacterized protein (TIGR03435 family)
LFAQKPAAAPAFEVASIKPSEPVTPAMVASGRIHAGMRIDAAQVDIGMLSLMALICKAYDVKPYQVSGPDWLSALNGQKFDIVAKRPEGSTKEQVPLMLQALLAERFKLTIHRETKEERVYALVAGKDGPKLKESEAAPPAPEPPASSAPKSSEGATGSNQVSFKASGNGMVVSDSEGNQTKISMSADRQSMHMESSKMTMAQFADSLTAFVDRPVVDMTGLKGNYQIAMDISMQDLMNAAKKAGMSVPSGSGSGDAGRPADSVSDPGSSSALQNLQTLGLKLDTRKLPLERIVIDHVEKTPTEN